MPQAPFSQMLDRPVISYLTVQWTTTAGEKSDTEGAKLPPIRALQIALCFNIE